MKRNADFLVTRYNAYVPACGYAADIIHGAPLDVDFGTPAAASAAAVLSATDTTAAGSNSATLLDYTSDANYGQNLTVVASGAATNTVTIDGWDYLGQPMTETMTVNGATPVVGVKAFKTLRKVTWTAAAVTINVGWGSKLGLPYVTHRVLGETADGVTAAAGTLVTGIRTDPQTAITVDPRGGYTPTTTANGVKRLRAVILVDNFVNSSGNGGLHGIRHFSS